jgi:phage terminase small subunit
MGKPAALKLATGRGNGLDAGGHPINTAEHFDRAMPVKPDRMPPRASAAWDHLAPSLHRAGLLKSEDVYGLTCLCMAWQDFWDAMAPSQRFAAAREIRSWVAHFGLSPATEQKLISRAEEADDPFDNSKPGPKRSVS